MGFVAVTLIVAAGAALGVLSTAGNRQSGQVPAPAASAPLFDAQPVASGVSAAIRKGPPGVMPRANAVEP